jgi:hypothetical protein
VTPALVSRSTGLAIPYLVLITACGGPAGIIPGGELSGEEGTAGTWSEVVSESGTLDIETRPEDPYSVRVNYVFRDGNVYIDPAEGRAWYQHLIADRSVRVRIDGRIYRARAVAVTDSAEQSGFDPERVLQRLELVERSGN